MSATLPPGFQLDAVTPQTLVGGSALPPGFRLDDPAEGLPGPRQESPGRGGGFLPFVYRGVATILGAPVDIANAVIGMDPRNLPFGVGQAAAAAGAQPARVSEKPFGGSASIEAGLARFGASVGVPMVPEPGQKPEGAAEYVGRGVGEAAGALIPGYGLAARLAQSANPVVSRIAQRVASAPATAPVNTLSAELAAGAGAGYGRLSAEEAFPNVAGAGALGELAGGTSANAMLAAPKILAYSPSVYLARRAFTPFTQAGGEARASRRLGSLVPDAEAAAKAASEPSIGELTPAQRTGDVRLLALEKAVADADPAIAQQLRDRATAAQKTLEEETRALGGDPMQTRAFLESRVARLSDALTARVVQAQTKARERIAALEPTTSADAASIIAREEFDKAYDAARAQERVLWNSIPGDVKIDTAPLFDRFAALVQDTPRTLRHNIPDYAKRFLSKEATDEQSGEVLSTLNTLYPGAFSQPKPSQRLGATASPADLQGLRSELLDIERTARDAGRRNEARIAGKIADDVLDLLDNASEIAGPYAVARNFSRELNEVFRRGGVAPLSRTAGGSEPRVPPELTLETLLGAGGPRAAVAARDLQIATGDTPSTRAAIENYLTRSLHSAAITSEGRVKPETAANWMRRNEALLERFPDVRNRLVESLSAQGQAETQIARQVNVARRLQNPKESDVARFLGADPGEEAARVLAAPDPATVAASLRRSADRDPSGNALAGLRGAFVENLLVQAKQTTPDGAVIRGSTILAALDNPKQAAALQAVFDPASLRRLRQIGTELMALERTRGQLPSVGGVMNDAPAKLLEIAARVAAARTAAAVSTDTGVAGGLQAAQIASGSARQFMQRLTNDKASKLLTQAVTDPELFAALMSPTRTAQQKTLAARRLQVWLAGPAGREFAGDNGEPSPPTSNTMAPQNINAFAR